MPTARQAQQQHRHHRRRHRGVARLARRACAAAAGVCPPRALATLPNVIPSEHGRAADFSGFIEAVHTRMEAPVERLLTAPPAAVVADMFLPWAVPMALRMGVTACSFCPNAATHFAAFYHLESLVAAHRTTGPPAIASPSQVRPLSYAQELSTRDNFQLSVIKAIYLDVY